MTTAQDDEFTDGDDPLTHWPPYTVDAPVYAKFNGYVASAPILSIEHGSTYSQGQCDLWDSLVPPPVYPCE